jgi:hypothetical protein
MTAIRKLIRVDGTEVELHGPHSIQDVQTMIGASTLDTVLLRSLGEPLHVMLVDDTGMIDGRPVNAKATDLYHAQCRPGNPYQIHGDVVIVPDGDYAEV